MTPEDILAEPALLENRDPAELTLEGVAPRWRYERLRKGSRRGEGWVLRDYDAGGVPTGAVIRWHPGGGHHGAQPYWRVSSPVAGRSDIIRARERQ